MTRTSDGLSFHEENDDEEKGKEQLAGIGFEIYGYRFFDFWGSEDKKWPLRSLKNGTKAFSSQI